MIFVGGTGLYFRALTQGPFGDSSRAGGPCARGCAPRPGPLPSAALHAATRRPRSRDAPRGCAPATGSAFLRALEVFAATGVPLASFQGARGAPALEAGRMGEAFFLAPDREALNARHRAAFRGDADRGALEEVAALARAASIPRCRSCAPMACPTSDRPSRRAACRWRRRRACSILDTRHYAKRQFTWARHQMPDFAWVAPEEALGGRRARVRRLSLTRALAVNSSAMANKPTSPDKHDLEDARAEHARLGAEIAKHDKLYHGEDAPTISDADYDALRRRYEALEDSVSRTRRTPIRSSRRVGAAPSEKFAKVRHVVPMLSLGNIFDDDEVGGILRARAPLSRAAAEAELA